MNSDPSQQDEGPPIALPGPVINPAFNRQLDRLVALGRQGQSADSLLFNPSEQWLIDNIRVFQDLPAEERGGPDEGSGGSGPGRRGGQRTG